MVKIVTIHAFKAELAAHTRVIGIDYGRKKIGLSLSDREKIIASPFQVLIRKKLTTDIESLSKTMHENAVSGIVFGYPVETSGNIGLACADVEKFAQEIEVKHSMPFYFQDERLSTSAVRRILNHTNMSRERKEQVDDKMSACYILQIVLDMMNKAD